LHKQQGRMRQTPGGTTSSIAVVIPCWNADKWIARAIQSALDQNCPNLEIIVADDGSTDGSLDVVKSFGDKIKWITGPNTGACAARNAGLHSTSCDWVMFLDADDYIMPGSLAAWQDAGDNADVVIGPFEYEHGMARCPSARIASDSDNLAVLSRWLEGWFTPPCAILWRRDFLAAIGGWKEPTLPRNQDGELVMRAMLEGARVAVCDHGLGVYVQHDGSGRVSQRSGRKAVASEFGIHKELWSRAQERNLEITKPSFAAAFYRIAYQAFSQELDDIGKDALAEARRLGLRGHVGSKIHRMLAGTLGLRNKLRLTGIIKRRHNIREAR
jgi:glycosyltransferase involved in cell wall biosynthesis